MKQRVTTGVLLALFPIACVVPVFGNDYQITFLLHTMLFVGLAYSWNLLSGYTGYLSFGTMAYVGIGMYAFTLIVIHWHWPWIVAALAAGVISGAAAIPIGSLILRFRGLEFAVGTLAVAQILQVVVSMNPHLGTATGLFLPPVLATKELFYFAFIVVVALFVVTWRVENSRFGLKLISIREDEVAARALGIPTKRVKLQAYVLSAVAPGIIGALWAWDFGYVNPSFAFNVLWEVTFITIAIFGGMGRLWGPFLGASLAFISEYLWAAYPFYHIAINGAVIILIVVVMPGGVVAILEELRLLAPSRTLSTRTARRLEGNVVTVSGHPAPRET